MSPHQSHGDWFWVLQANRTAAQQAADAAEANAAHQPQQMPQTEVPLHKQQPQQQPPKQEQQQRQPLLKQEQESPQQTAESAAPVAAMSLPEVFRAPAEPAARASGSNAAVAATKPFQLFAQVR